MEGAVRLRSGNPSLDQCFILAQETLAKNIHPFRDGLLAEAAPVIIAGGDYDTPWTRDAAFNTWFAGGLLAPEAAPGSCRSPAFFIPPPMTIRTSCESFFLFRPQASNSLISNYRNGRWEIPIHCLQLRVFKLE